MKKTTLLLISSLVALTLNAKEISVNSTLHQYAKPGAAIDMKYSSQAVDVNEVSDVNITLSSAVTNGTVSAIISLDKNLSSLSEFDNNISFKLLPNQQDFVINLQVKSAQQGLYYIRLLTKLDKGYGIKLRSFAIPVYIGEVKAILNKGLNLQMKVLNSGENISVSKAVETIEVVKE